MILRLRRVNGEQRKLVFSVSSAFLTRVPGAIGLVWFLPLLRFGLGTDGYANMLAAMALASVVAFMGGGFNLMARRMIGEAYANGDRQGEANAFASVALVNIAAAILSVAVILAYCWIRNESREFAMIAGLTAVGTFLMLFENVRAAYNENYVTSILMVLVQSIAYAIGFLVPATRHDSLISSLIIQSPYWLASVMTFVLLLRNRRYLLGGRPVDIAVVLRQGMMLAMADGFLFATLSLAVVWLQATTIATTAAWFATNVRLFQTFLVPVSLLMLPLSSYIRISWNSKSAAQQQAYTKATLALGIAYGMVVAAALYFISAFYVGQMLSLPVTNDVSIFILFGAIIAYRSYSSVAYVVLNETTHLSSWTMVSIAAAVSLGAVASVAVDPLRAIDVYAVIGGATMLAVLFWNVARFIRSPPTVSA